MDAGLSSVLISLTMFIIQEAKRQKMSDEEIKTQFAINVAEFYTINPELIPNL